MCGIIGYTGNRRASPIILRGLKRLEYRGYDSAGIATVSSKIHVKKDRGRVDEINTRLNLEELPGTVGIGHTRWATHGAPNTINAHPHVDCKQSVAVVHNGIIENYSELKSELISRGHIFRSDVDTEVIPHLIEEFIKDGKTLRDAVIETSKLLKGCFAFLVISNGDERIFASRYKCPLILGIGNGENFVASDAIAFLEFTKRAIFLDDHEVAEIGRDYFRVFNLQGEEKEKKINIIEWDIEEAQRSGFEHYMIKEIYEQAEILSKTVSQDKRNIEKIAEMINTAPNVVFTGCGTSYHACLSASYVFSQIAGKHVDVFLASEFSNFYNSLPDGMLMVAVSQSGETADVLEAVRTINTKGRVVSIVNVVGSSLARMSDAFLCLNAGPEICVLATKSFTSQLALLNLLAYTCAGKYEEGKRRIQMVAKEVSELLSDKNVARIKELSRILKNTHDIFLIGRGLSYPIVLEGALKIKEASYIHAEGFAGGELKHGTLALIEDNTPCIVFVTEKNEKETLSNVSEIKSRGAYIIGVSPNNYNIFDFWIRVPECGVENPIVQIIPIQILAYQLAVLRGCEPDHPRSLAKSVTVP